MNKLRSGDVGEAIVIAEALRRGYEVAIPYSTGIKYDLIVDRRGKLERIQVKRVKPKDGALQVATKTMVYDKTAGTNNRNRMVKYTRDDFDWLAVVDEDTDKCYFIPMDEIDGRAQLTVRLRATKNGQSAGVRMAEEFCEW